MSVTENKDEVTKANFEGKTHAEVVDIAIVWGNMIWAQSAAVKDLTELASDLRRELKVARKALALKTEIAFKARFAETISQSKLMLAEFVLLTVRGKETISPGDQKTIETTISAIEALGKAQPGEAVVAKVKEVQDFLTTSVPLMAYGFDSAIAFLKTHHSEEERAIDALTAEFKKRKLSL